MRLIVFLGSSLPHCDAAKIIDADLQPPASQGDVYTAALLRPDAIAIIDGYFGLQPAVWHKEILWAMAQGIHVFGAASMGALRAAELGPFGMIGHGWVYQAYCDDVLDGDDEVAITHGPAETGYVQSSEALVNMRRTFSAAAAAGIVTTDTTNHLVQTAKNFFFPDRHYDQVIAAANLTRNEATNLMCWIQQHRIDQKRLDAAALLHQLRRNSDQLKTPKCVDYTFNNTVFWAASVEMSRKSLMSRYKIGGIDHVRANEFIHEILENAHLQRRQQ